MTTLTIASVSPLIEFWNNLWSEDFDHWCDPCDEDSNEVIEHAEIEDELDPKAQTINVDLVEKIISNCEGMADDIVHYSYGDVKLKDLNLKTLTPFKKMIAKAKKS